MNLSILELLSLDDVKAFSLASRLCRKSAMSTLFKSVKLDGYDAVEIFLSRFPSACRIYIRSLFISMRPKEVTQQCHPVASQTDLLVILLSTCTMIRSLTLYLFGSPQKHIVPPFARLIHLTSLFIGNVAPEQLMPLSERSVVSIAASVPYLERLTLDGITRSFVHAPELLAAYPFVPLVVGDEDVEPHPTLGSDLSLPSLLRIPTLRKLQLMETHLGDRLWGTTPSSPRLEILDLGACAHVPPEFNMMCTERIINNLARSSPIQELFVSTPLQDERFRDPLSTPLQSLHHIRLMPLLPVDCVVETLFTLSGSPIHTISVECYEEDAVEMCYALEGFLTMRSQQPDASFYPRLKVMNLHFVVLDPSFPMSDHNEGLGRIRKLCDGMGLAGEMPSLSTTTEMDGAGRAADSRIMRKPWWSSSQDTTMQDVTW